jgi:hypothetical protein
VDWTGEDYWSTNNPDEINKFWTWLSQNGANATGSYTFLADAWFRMGDEEFIEAYEKYGQQALTYNDQTNKLYSSYVTYENNEFVVNGVSVTAMGTPANNAFGLEEAYSLGMTSGGIYTGLKELSNVHNGRWKGKNGKWNDLSWGGNRYTGARKVAVNKAKLYNRLGKGLFGIGVIVNIAQALNDYKNDEPTTRYALNVAFGIVSTWGGIPGMIIGCIYSGTSFEHRFIVPPKNNYMISPVDNTFVKRCK